MDEITSVLIAGKQLAARELGRRVRVNCGNTSIEGLLTRVEHRGMAVESFNFNDKHSVLRLPESHRLSVTVGGIDWDDLDVDLISVEVFDL